MARSPIEPQRPMLSVEQKQNVIRRLRSRIAELEEFDPTIMQERFNVPELMALEASVSETLAAAFGQNTPEYRRYARAADLDHGPITMRSGFERGPRREDMPEVFQGYVRSGRDQAVALLKQAVRGLEEELPANSREVVPSSPRVHSSKVFVVHGHDNDAKNEIARFLSKVGLVEIILHERPNAGRNLLTKFQEEADGASFAVVLITPDDVGGPAGTEGKPRARQNVIFELGFFIGKLGPSRVAAVVKGDVETPSDFDGIGYIKLDKAGAWKSFLARELRQAEVPFDAMKVFEA